MKQQLMNIPWREFLLGSRALDQELAKWPIQIVKMSGPQGMLLSHSKEFLVYPLGKEITREPQVIYENAQGLWVIVKL
jgi:hypothetical protein